MIAKLMQENCIFHESNVRVAELDGKIVGIALVVDASSRTSPPPDCRCVGKGFADARERYFPLSQMLLPASVDQHTWSACVWSRVIGESGLGKPC